ncbi:MAG: protein kinase [Pyrinomonadaceae bacterium]
MSPSTELLQKGRYRIDSPSVAGSSNQVYRAYDTTSDCSVFVKEIVFRLNKVTTLSQQANMRLAFENAARRLTEFRHDSLLSVLDYYTEVGRQYLVLETVDGVDLATMIANDDRSATAAQIIDWGDQLLEGIVYLHQQNPPIIHGRIRPENITISANGKVKLTGYSLDDGSGNELSTQLHEASQTNLNFSPLESIWESLDAASQKVILSSYDDRSERTLKEPADARSDLYSLGATLYYLITGTVPVDPLERSIELLEGNPDPLKSPDSLDSTLAPEIAEIVMRAMEIKRENRFDSAVIMRQVLRTAAVRIKEREAAEAQELAEAAEVLRHAQQPSTLPHPTPAFDAAPVETASPTPRPSETEILAQKLREAEELRLEAERRAAEAERLLREQEAQQPLPDLQPAAEQHSFQPVSADDDLLGLIETSNPPSFTAPVAAPRDLAADKVDEAIHTSVKPAPVVRPDKPAADAEPVVQAAEATPETAREEKHEPAAVADVSAESEVVTPKVAREEKHEPAFVAEVSGESTFVQSEPVRETHDLVTPAPKPSEPVSSAFDTEYRSERKPFPMAMAAGAAAVVLLVVVVGGWMLLGSGGSPETPPPAAVQTQSAAVPQPDTPQVTEQPSTETDPASAYNEPVQQTESNPAAVETSSSRPAAKAVATPKAAKPTPDVVKTPAPKKTVTVDDLINDN